MPVTAITMLIGCLAIAGVGVPFLIGFSGYYSKDMILEQAYSLSLTNPGNALASLFFVMALGGASITAFYMFRMWFMTFVGEPRDAHAYDHAHESPPIMYLPLVLLAVLAIAVAWEPVMIGYAVIPAGILIWQSSKRGWFAAIRSPNGGHASHDDHAGSHGGATHQAGGGHHAADDQHGHGSIPSRVEHHDHGHAAHPGEGPLPWTLRGVVGMIVIAVVGGTLIAAILPRDLLSGLALKNLLEQARPAGTAADAVGKWVQWTWPNEHTAHEEANHARIVVPVTLFATGTWVLGIGLATAMYGRRYLNAEDVRRQFSPIYRLLINKWWFDELYDWLFVRPTHVVARVAAGVDRSWIDGLLHAIAAAAKSVSVFWDKLADRTIVDGAANLTAHWTHSVGLALRQVQTGKLRQYVMFIVVGALALFILISFFWNSTLAR
jgi:NADH-quinone oxidoreductase subunit L